MASSSAKKHTENKKVRNASPNEYDGILFKSRLERVVYQTLKEHGFPVRYEPRKFVLWNGFRPTVPFYNGLGTGGMAKPDRKKLMDITYVPDFIFTHKGKTVIIESKGIENDVFPLKRKLFRQYLEVYLPDSLFFEVRTKRQLLQAIAIIEGL